MATDDEDTKPAEAAPPAKKKTVMIIIIAVVAVLLIAGGTGFVVLNGKKKEEKTDALNPDAAEVTDGALAPEGATEQDELEEGEEALGAIFPLDPFVVNLQGGGFVRTQLQIEFNERDIPKRLYSRIVPVRDALITMLTKKKQEDLASEEGKETLKKEAKDLINTILKKEEVKRIYFTQFLVQ